MSRKPSSSRVESCRVVADVQRNTLTLELNEKSYALLLGSPIILQRGKEVYRVDRQSDGRGNVWLTCSCPWFVRWGKGEECKHLGALQLLGYVRK